MLYPALQKLYSALSHLEQFHTGNDFFDNIKSLDSFFSEYRNITFVLQKSVSKTDYEQKYKELREKYLSGDLSQWFVNARNKVLKEQPFQLEKRILVTVYDAKIAQIIFNKVFTIEEDKEYKDLLNELGIFFN
ncbi:MAG: hypothetical protein ACRC9P_01705, partial [Bacteroides sp.]